MKFTIDEILEAFRDYYERSDDDECRPHHLVSRLIENRFYQEEDERKENGLPTK